MSRRVVITGAGLVSALGDSSESLFAALCEGRRAHAPIQGIDTSGLKSRTGAAIQGFVEKTYLGVKNMRPYDRTARLVLAAARLASDSATLTIDDLKQREAGLVLGTMFCSVRTIAEFDRRAITAGVEYASVMDFANTVINAAAGQTAIWYGLRGLNATICGGLASGLQALGYAADMIRLGRSSLIYAGGGEEFSFEGLLGFERAGWLSTEAECPVPFDSRRDGMVLGEGAALLVLEDSDSAAARGAVVKGEILGHATGFDRSRGKDVQTGAAALERCIRGAMAEARVEPASIGLVSVSANGSTTSDQAEALAIGAALNSRAAAVPVMAVKAALGEPVGAGGALQTIAAIEAMRQGSVPGITGLAETGDSFPLGAVSAFTGPLQASTALITSQGLDGNCCALIVRGT
ncbi:MAG: hypothetical protein FJW39_32885 [Acidobacteria bacterium]|nr:hypothetical protein [Acidobacteriota bacterium]